MTTFFQWQPLIIDYAISSVLEPLKYLSTNHTIYKSKSAPPLPTIDKQKLHVIPVCPKKYLGTGGCEVLRTSLPQRKTKPKNKNYDCLKIQQG